MRAQFVIPVLASILILGTLGMSYDAFAGIGDNSGNIGCEKADPNSKVCEKNPNAEPPDTEPPIITASTSPPPNANDWNDSDVTITFGCVDNEGGSGVASLTPDVIIQTEGANQQFIGTCTDNAGNSATVTVTVNIDKTDPTGTVLINDGDAGTNSLTVTLTITCADFVSGCISMQVAVDGTVDTESVQTIAGSIEVTLPAGDGTKTVAVRVIDQAGNPSAQVTDSIVVLPLPFVELEIFVDGVKQFPSSLRSSAGGSATQDASGVIRMSLNVICDPLDVGCNEFAIIEDNIDGNIPAGTTINFKLIQIVGLPQDTVFSGCTVLVPSALSSSFRIPQDTIIGDNVATTVSNDFLLIYSCNLVTAVF